MNGEQSYSSAVIHKDLISQQKQQLSTVGATPVYLNPMTSYNFY